jgi:hypothetical protein
MLDRSNSVVRSFLSSRLQLEICSQSPFSVIWICSVAAAHSDLGPMVGESSSVLEGVSGMAKNTFGDCDVRQVKKPGNEKVQCPHCGHECKQKRLQRHLAHCPKAPVRVS